MTRRFPSLRTVTGSQAVLALATTISAILALTVSGPIMLSDLHTAHAAQVQADRDRQQIVIAGKVKTDPKIAQRLSLLHQAFPSDPDLAAYLDVLRKLSGSSGLTWVSSTADGGATQPLSAASPTRLRTWAVVVTVRGPDTGIADYLSRVQTMSRLTVVDSVTLSGDQQPQAAISLRTYSTESTG